MREYRMYLGHRKGNGTMISDYVVQMFLANQGDLPDSYNISRTTGWYRGHLETCTVLTFVTNYPLDSTLRLVGARYKDEFDQDQVLITKKEVEVLPC